MTQQYDASTGELLARLSGDVTELVRSELKLAQAEVTEKAKRAGIGAGMVGAAGVLALYGGGVLVATAILALALVVDAWIASLVVGVVVLALATVVALMGKKQVSRAAPPVPSKTLQSVKKDVQAAKNGRDR